MPNGIPRYVRCYDYGGSGDRYTVVFSGNYAGRGGVCHYICMSGAPFHPQGVCQHGGASRPIDVRTGSWGGVAIGRKCHLGKRIPFTDLPEDCQKVVMKDYKEMWRL